MCGIHPFTAEEIASGVIEITVSTVLYYQYQVDVTGHELVSDPLSACEGSRPHRVHDPVVKSDTLLTGIKCNSTSQYHPNITENSLAYILLLS